MTSPLFASLWTSQSGRCAICGEPMPATRWETPHATVWKKRRPTLDHVRPRAKGGSDAPSNLQLAHAACNWIKGDDWRPQRKG
jgi:5-methylcytosine-specific restriction endonuclease McrA